MGDDVQSAPSRIPARLWGGAGFEQARGAGARRLREDRATIGAGYNLPKSQRLLVAFSPRPR
jgi:hypothetical protein